ncbi:MAG: DUF1499 domain-containing protein [Rhizomicrobium sp.]
MRAPLFAARLALAALIAGALIAAAAVAWVRLGLISFETGLLDMTASVAFCLIALILSGAWLIHALKHNKGMGKRAGLIAFFGSLVLLYMPLHTVYQGMMAPPIHDATTDPEDPPRFVTLANRPKGANSTQFDGNRLIRYRGEQGTVSYILHEYYEPITKPLALLMPRAKMFWRCFETAKHMGWEIVDYNEKEGRIEAKAGSFWFGQVSDIVIRVRQAGPLGARFDMRAESERGGKDFGRNLGLIEAYRHDLNS